MWFLPMKSVRTAIILITLSMLIGTALPAKSAAKPNPPPQIEIPTLGIKVQITTARYRRTYWDFASITNKAAFLQHRPKPGQGKNAIIAAHYELPRRKPGPFYRLSELKAGDPIIVTLDGIRYTYAVTEMWTVDPSDISPIYATDGEMLTLLTCSDYVDGEYTTRLVIRAVLTKHEQ
jgi:LPXTG-site transpeptidase (sortase) family protein